MAAVIFVNRYCFPDESATSQLVSDLAFDLAQNEYQVHIIACRQLHNDRRAALDAFEEFDELSIHRVWTSSWGRGHLLGRALDYLTFHLSAAAVLWRIARTGDVIVAKTDPPLLGTMASIVANFRRATVINWMQDIYPEVAETLRVAGSAIVGRSLRWLRTRACNAAVRNVVIGRCMREQLIRAGVSPDRIVVVPNWVGDEVIRPLEPERNVLREQWGLKQSFVVGYSGNVGRAHEFEALLQAAHRLGREKNIQFLMIGDGAKRTELEARARVMGLRNISFQPLQPTSRLALSLTVPDVHIVTLKSSLLGLIVPSKFYGALAAGRPVIFIGPKESEVARVIHESDCGFCVYDGSAQAVADAILALSNDPALRHKMGANARKTLDEQYSRQNALLAWHEIIKEILPLSVARGENVTRESTS